MRASPRAFAPAQRLDRWHQAIGPLFCKWHVIRIEDASSGRNREWKPAQNPLHLNRREFLQTVGATVAPATAANDLTGAASAAATTINTSRNADGFGPPRIGPVFRRRRASPAHDGDECARRMSRPAGRCARSTAVWPMSRARRMLVPPGGWDRPIG